MMEEDLTPDTRRRTQTITSGPAIVGRAGVINRLRGSAAKKNELTADSRGDEMRVEEKWNGDIRP
jgi:hypothetical protein